MSSNRIIDHPVLGKLEDRKKVTFTFDGKKYEGFEGDTIASALLANGVRQLRVHENSGTPRGIYCNIGHCFECRVVIDDQSGFRACMTEVKEGMEIESGKVQPSPLDPSNKKLPRTYAEYIEMKKEDDLDA